MFLHENERTFERIPAGSVFQPPVSRAGERRLRERYDLSGQACVQRRLRVVLRGVERDYKYQYMKERSDRFINPQTNYTVIRQIIERTIGEQYCTYLNMQEIARELKVEIAPDPAQAPLPLAADRTRFSYIPDGCHEGQLAGILHNPVQGRFQYGGETYYHHTGSYPSEGKPIWKIDADGRIRILGMYEHGGTNKIYHKRGDGAGLDTIRLP